MTDITKEKINEYILRITGSACIPKNLEVDKEYTIELKADCYKKELRSNNDGSYNAVYSLKQTGEATIKGENEVILAKPRNSRSKALRGALWLLWQERNEGKDFEKWYEEKMNKIIFDLGKII